MRGSTNKWAVVFFAVVFVFLLFISVFMPSLRLPWMNNQADNMGNHEDKTVLIEPPPPVASWFNATGNKWLDNPVLNDFWNHTRRVPVESIKDYLGFLHRILGTNKKPKGYCCVIERRIFMRGFINYDWHSPPSSGSVYLYSANLWYGGRLIVTGWLNNKTRTVDIVIHGTVVNITDYMLGVATTALASDYNPAPPILSNVVSNLFEEGYGPFSIKWVLVAFDLGEPAVGKPPKSIYMPHVYLVFSVPEVELSGVYDKDLHEIYKWYQIMYYKYNFRFFYDHAEELYWSIIGYPAMSLAYNILRPPAIQNPRLYIRDIASLTYSMTGDNYGWDDNDAAHTPIGTFRAVSACTEQSISTAILVSDAFGFPAEIGIMPGHDVAGVVVPSSFAGIKGLLPVPDVDGDGKFDWFIVTKDIADMGAEALRKGLMSIIVFPPHSFFLLNDYIHPIPMFSGAYTVIPDYLGIPEYIASLPRYLRMPWEGKVNITGLAEINAGNIKSVFDTYFYFKEGVTNGLIIEYDNAWLGASYRRAVAIMEKYANMTPAQIHYYWGYRTIHSHNPDDPFGVPARRINLVYLNRSAASMPSVFHRLYNNTWEDIILALYLRVTYPIILNSSVYNGVMIDNFNRQNYTWPNDTLPDGEYFNFSRIPVSPAPELYSYPDIIVDDLSVVEEPPWIYITEWLNHAYPPYVKLVFNITIGNNTYTVRVLAPNGTHVNTTQIQLYIQTLNQLGNKVKPIQTKTTNK